MTITSELNPCFLVDRPCEYEVLYLASPVCNELLAKELTALELSECSEAFFTASRHMPSMAKDIKDMVILDSLACKAGGEAFKYERQ